MYPELAQFKTWLKCQYPGSSVSVHYSSDLTFFFSFTGKAPVTVTPYDVDDYIFHCQQAGHSPASINRRLSALCALYYFMSITCDTPPDCPVLPRHRLRKSKPLPRVDNDADLATLFAHIHHPRDKAIFQLMLDCGLRVGEVQRLSCDDLHFNDPPRLEVYGKGGRQRIVYLSPPAQEMLQIWLKHRPVSTDRAVFVSRHKKRLSVAGIQYRLRSLCQAAGVEITCHQLRHTFGRRMAESHLPLTSLQALLGHQHVRTTQIYVHLSDAHLHTEYNRAVAHLAAPTLQAKRAIPKTRREPCAAPPPRQVNWAGYLEGLPGWLAELLRAYCAGRGQIRDPIHHSRWLLSCLTICFRWAQDHNINGVGEKCGFELCQLTPRLWFSFVESRLNTGIEPSSLNTTLHILRSFLKYARESGIPICDRMRAVRPLKTPQALPRDLDITQLNHIIERSPLEDAAWILLMAHSGLRTCEVRGLRWCDLDLQRRTVRVEESKGLRSRVVFLSPLAVEALAQLTVCSEFVFTHRGLPLGRHYCQSRLRTLGRQAGVKCTPHQLRHSCATGLLNAGMSIFAVQSILGHRYVDTTLRYARVLDATVAKDYQKVMEYGNSSW